MFEFTLLLGSWAGRSLQILMVVIECPGKVHEVQSQISISTGFHVEIFGSHAKCLVCWKCSRMQRADRMSKESEYRQYKVSVVRLSGSLFHLCVLYWLA